jgi:hypothetical protein
MAHKKEAETHILVKVICPHCKSTGRVDMSKLDRSFTCGKCNKSFHIDVRHTKKGKREDNKEVDPASLQLNLDQPDKLERIMRRIPRSAKIAIPAAFGLFLLWWLLGDMLLPGEPLPESADERARIVVNAMIARDIKPIQRLIYSDANFVDCSEWIKQARPSHWPASKPGAEVVVNIQTQVQNTNRQKDPAKTGYVAAATVLVMVDLPGTSDGKRHYITYWKKKSDDTDWRFDIKRTRAIASK